MAREKNPPPEHAKGFVPPAPPPTPMDWPEHLRGFVGVALVDVAQSTPNPITPRQHEASELMHGGGEKDD